MYVHMCGTCCALRLCSPRACIVVLVLGECAFRLLVMWCVVDAGKLSENGARKYAPCCDAVVVLSDIGIVWPVRVIFGIVDLESCASYTHVSLGSICCCD